MDATGADAEFDLLVIGGGITGVGIAQDAASRGLRTVLVERGDFACGTSSRSSKLIHGGLRYLEQFSLGLMYESIAERHLLTRLAPGLVRWRPFLLPSFQGKGKEWRSRLGLWLYDHLARTDPELRHRRLGRDDVLRFAPELRRQGLQGGARFFDCVTDDARLVLSVARDAQARGARIHNYVAVEEVVRERGRACGARVRDTLTGARWEIRARQVVSASGPWTDRTLELAGESAREKRIRPAKGVHVVLERGRLDVGSVVMIPSARDRRSLFVIPWYEGVLVGTTDTEYRGGPDAARPEREDVDYILAALDWSFPSARLALPDVVSSYAGVRPLVRAPGRSTADVPREYRIFEGASGMLSVAGGKLTTYRRMAKAVVDRVVLRLKGQGLDRPVLRCWTHRMPLGSPAEDGFDPFRGIDLPEDVRAHLLADYGLWARQIVSILELHPEWARPMAEGLPYIVAEAYFAVTHEKARTVVDVLARRTRVALLDRAQGRGCLDAVSKIMAEELAWSEEERARQVGDYERVLREEFRGGGSFSGLT
ncbi:MAG: hypothetical protein DMG07_04090 [Acidobacteria bacterium]|nr:MAG: hypothetical protein DMG07_04090 [Acidobacteriota bacterium]